ncbi:hypothetical protein IAE22_33130, partial [Bacillus sp. S34]|nr:hypothetical protein [Bacillus sp. S34]
VREKLTVSGGRYGSHMSFAERMGFTAPRSVTQTDSLDLETRTELWNTVYVIRGKTRRDVMAYDVDTAITAAIWAWYLKNARDEQPRDEQGRQLVRRRDVLRVPPRARPAG